ncbi:MAG TPA: AraC family transcriptional regulator [Candidatus Scatomonas merdigallinarum]|nr:AraC family transcriptional regulator [Candidatus Scatomonas merdigallinarum]
MSIFELADSLGYSSAASFINAFKARRGVSPARYRKLLSEKHPR